METEHPFFADMRKTKEKITDFVSNWHHIFGLDEWQIDLEYHYDRDVDCPKMAAEACVQWQYKRAQLHFYLPVLCVESDEKLEWTVVHEIQHILVNEMREYDDSIQGSINHEERVVSTLTNAFLRAKDGVK